MGSESRNLLIVACSKRKRFDSSLLPAIERYDGSTFRTIRRFLRLKPPEVPDIYILSAEFGLISSEQMIPNYDRKMTRDRTLQLQPKVITDLKQILNSNPYKKLLICVSRDYLQALNGYEQIIPDGLIVQKALGASGKKLSELYYWLYGRPALKSSPTAVTPQGRACLRGVEVALTPMQVLEEARRVIAEGKGEPQRYISWYILIDGQKVAPKWLVSQLTGLPVKAFTASEARRVLCQLGLQVRQITETD
jgi:hypothetical protein